MTASGRDGYAAQVYETRAEEAHRNRRVLYFAREVVLSREDEKMQMTERAADIDVDVTTFFPPSHHQSSRALTHPRRTDERCLANSAVLVY